MALDGDGRAEAELVHRFGTFDAVAERARRARMKGAALLTAAEFPEEDPGQQFESLTDDGVRLDMATSRTSGAIQYYFHGQGVSPEAEIWHGRREDLFRKLLEPDGLAVGDGRVVSEN
ncbi:MAG TPA: hypothetical protein VGS80_16480 [Ktedonobacterales bacterium]|nr:hypothetical protein [Ktedonobacterales bacterium]